jgi:hypothetical protein
MKYFVRVLKAVPALILLSVLTVALAAPAGVAYAAPDPAGTAGGGVINPLVLMVLNTLGDDNFAQANLTTAMGGPSATQHNGQYASGSPDSGTCNVGWADDTFDRHFTVHNNHDGTYDVVEQFKDGSFTTNNSPSPGACDSSDGTPPGAIAADKTGSMQGYLILTVTGMQTSQDAACIARMPSAPCTTGGFLASHFTIAATADGPFFFHYSAGDQGLIYHEWKNASCDRGGNHGDIASAAAAAPSPPVAICQ